jgi:hypothetical protein
MANNIFTARNMFYPYKDYNSFLGGKLTVFKLCNYGIMLALVRRVIFGIVSAYFIVYESYFIIGKFCRTIRTVYAYFAVYGLFFLFMISIGMSGHFGAGPLWV